MTTLRSALDALELSISGYAPEVSNRTVRFLESLLEGDVCAPRFREAISFFEEQRERLMVGSSRRRIDMTDEQNARYETMVHEFRSKFMAGGAVHLEQGIWNDFPDDRIEVLARSDMLAEFITFDFEPSYCPAVVGDVQCLPFLNETLDRVSSVSLYEHLAHPHKAIQESFRVLRPGGVLRITTVFLYTLHGGASPHDYLRFTPQYFKRVCRECGFETVYSESDATSGAYYNMHGILKATRVDPTSPNKDAAERIRNAVLMLCAALTPFDKDFRGGARSLFKSVETVAVKAGDWTSRQRPDRRSGTFLDRNLDLLSAPGGGAPLVQGENVVGTHNGLLFPVEGGVPIFTPKELRV